jgi:hypothetical protein
VALLLGAVHPVPDVPSLLQNRRTAPATRRFCNRLFPPEIRKIVYTIGQYEQDLLAASSLRWQGESVPES